MPTLSQRLKPITDPMDEEEEAVSAESNEKIIRKYESDQEHFLMQRKSYKQEKIVKPTKITKVNLIQLLGQCLVTLYKGSSRISPSNESSQYCFCVFVCGHWQKTKELLELLFLFLLLFSIWFISSLKGI